MADISNIKMFDYSGSEIFAHVVAFLELRVLKGARYESSSVRV